MNNLDKVSEQYAKNKELKKEDVEILKEWMRKQPHLPNISEFQIILFLHSCYYRLEPTKACIETFYTVKAHCPEFFKKRNPRLYANDVFDPLLVTTLPRTTPEGYQVLFIKLISYEPNRFIVPNCLKSIDMEAMLNLHQNGTAPGCMILMDLKGASFSHLPMLNPTAFMKFFFYLQEALPFRLKGLCYFNIPTFMDKIMAIIKPYLKNDLMNSLRLFTDKLDDLYKLVPQECFPSDYGGQAESISELIEKRRQVYLENEQFFIDDEKEIADDAKRVGKPKNSEEIFGVEGTFKKLEID